MISSKYISDWPETQARFEKWWHREPTDRPLMHIVSPREKPVADSPEAPDPGPTTKYLDADYHIRRFHHVWDHMFFGAEAFPNADINFGPGSLALYLGSEPVFAETTVWFERCIDSLEDTPLPEFDLESKWFTTHLELIRKVREGLWPDGFVNIPDLVESTDILAAMRDPQTFLFDLMDRPEQVHRWLRRINDLYMPYYDPFYDAVKDDDGSSVFTAFQIWGPGKTVKIQCDIAATLSPDQFGEFYVQYAEEQIRHLDRVLYHLDGPDCICHVPQLLAMDDLHCIQWVPGAGAPDGGDEVWFPLYKQILDGGKGLQTWCPAGRFETLIKAFGSQGLFLVTGTETERAARELIATAEKLSKPNKPRESSS